MRSHRTVIYGVIACTFFVGFGGGVIFPILPNLGEVLGISSFLVGLILSANRFARLVANTPAGGLVDRIGTRKPFIVGLTVEGVATLGYVVALDSVAPEVWFLAARVTWGFGSALVFATAYTITADVSDSVSRGTSMGLVRAGITFGFPAGLILGGVLSDLYGVRVAFSVAAAFALCAGVLAYFIIPETHVAEHTAGIKPWQIDRSIPTLTAGLVNFALFFSYAGVLFASLVLYLDARNFAAFGFGPQGTSGFLMGLTVFSGAVFTLVGGKASDVFGERVPVLLGFLAAACVGFLLLVVADSLPSLIVGCLFIGAGQGGVGGPLMAFLADLTPRDRMGRATGTNNVLGDVGGGLGPLVSLPLIEVVGFVPVYAGCALVPLLAGFVLLGGTYLHTGSLNPSVDGSNAD